MNVAAILRAHGFVPSVPTCPQVLGTPESVVYQRVPKVPAEKSMGRSKTGGGAARHRPIVQFRLDGNGWATALGAAGETIESLIADLRRRWPGVEIAIEK